MIFKKKKEELYHKASKLALDNSELLYDEANILIDKDHYARGFVLCVISLEESTKSFLFRLISLNLVNEYKTMNFVHIHDNKLQQSSHILSFSTKLAEMLIELVKMAQKDGYLKTKLPLPHDYKERLEELTKFVERVAKLQSRKNDSLYVDVREGKIINPNDMIKKEQALMMLEMVDMQIGIVKSFIVMDNAKFLAMWKEPFALLLKIDELLKV